MDEEYDIKYQTEAIIFTKDNFPKTRALIEFYGDEDIEEEKEILINTIESVLEESNRPLREGEYFMIGRVVRIEEGEEDLF